MEYVQITLDDWLKEKEAMRMDLKTAADAFIRIGCRLKKWRDEKLYERDGYKNISEMAEKEYGLKKNTTSNFIGIAEKFVIPGTMELEDRYKGIGSSLLAEMLTLPEEDLELVNQDTTRAQIRDIKQFERREPNENLNGFERIIVEYFRTKQKELNAFYASEAYSTGDLEELVYILNPSGNQTYRKGMYMLFFYDLEQGIKYKVFGDATVHIMSYEQFFQKMQEIYQDSIAGDQTHQEYYGEPEQEEPEETGKKEDEKVPPAEPQSRINTECEPKLNENQKTEEKTPNDPEITPVSEPESADQSPEEEAETKKIKEVEEKPATETPKSPQKAISTECKEQQEEEQMPGQTGIIEDWPEIIPAMNPPEIASQLLTRKSYLEGCTEWGAAIYLHQYFCKGSELRKILDDAEQIEKWLCEKVNLDGSEIEEG